MTNRTSIDLSVNLPNELDKAIEMLSHISGVDRHKLQKMRREEVYTLLSYHIGQLSEEEQKLFSSHNQSEETDPIKAAEKWKLIKRGVIHEKKTDFGSVPKAAYDAVKFLIANLANRSRLLAENPGAERALTSDPLATIKFNKPRLPNSLGASNVTPRMMSSASAANINIPKEKIDLSTTSTMKDFFRRWILRVEGEVVKGK